MRGLGGGCWRSLAPRPADGGGRWATGGGEAAILQAASRAGDAKPALRIVDVAALIEERTGVNYSISGAHRLMQTMGLSYQKTRPSHPKADPKARERFKKASRPS